MCSLACTSSLGRIVRQCLTTDKPVKGDICESVSLNNYAQPLARVCILWDNPFWNSISASVGKIDKLCLLFFLLPLSSTYLQQFLILVVSRKTLTKLYFCNIFLHFFQNGLLGNNHGDTAKGKVAAQLGRGIGMETEQIPSCWHAGSWAVLTCVCGWIATFSVPNAQGLFSPSGSHGRMFLPIQKDI